jgi:hypothetical protein
MRVISRKRTALLCAEKRWYLTGSKLNGQMGLSEVIIVKFRYKDIKTSPIIIILWVTFKVGRLYFPFVTIPQSFLDLRKAECTYHIHITN